MTPRRWNPTPPLAIELAVLLDLTDTGYLFVREGVGSGLRLSVAAGGIIAPVIPPSIGLLCSTTSPDQAAALTGVGVDRLDVGDLSPAIAVEAARSWAGQAGRALPASVLAIVGEAARSPLWVRLAVDLLADLDAEDFASIAAAADQAAAIERLLFEEARSLPSDTADLAGVFLGRVAERIGDEPAALLLGVLATARSGLAPADLAARTDVEVHVGSLLDHCAALRDGSFAKVAWTVSA